MVENILEVCEKIYGLYQRVKANRGQAAQLTERVKLIESAISPFKGKSLAQLPKAINANLEALKRVCNKFCVSG